MKHFKIKTSILLTGALFMLQACRVFEPKQIIDPNSPSVETVLSNATASQLDQLGIGVQSAMRNGYYTQRLVSGSIGREVYNLSSTETTWVTELLGTTNGGLNNNTGFNSYYNDFAQIRRRAELFQRSANNTSAISEVQKNGIRGFANTIEAWAMLKNLNMQYQNGIRISFTDLAAPGDLLKPGPFVSYDAGLIEIKRLLDLGASQLATVVTAAAAISDPNDAAKVDSYSFMTSGWAGFLKPSTFIKFNRAVAAEVAIYQKDWTGALTALNGSFFNIGGSMTTGPVFTYSTTSGDMINPSFKNKDDIASPVVAQSSFVADAEFNLSTKPSPTIDNRITSKVAKRTTPRSFGGLIGEYDVFMYPTNTSPISIMRNEELILIYAEAKIQTGDFAEAVKALDAIRASAGLQPLAAAKPTIVADKGKLIDEMLNQRRYSLFYEGHRWFDMRRYDRLNQLPNDLPTAKVYMQMIRPFAEVQWDLKNPQ